MASYTTNYNLKKPASSDTVDVADINGNMDAIDTALASKADSADLAIVATTGSYNDLLNKPDLTTKLDKVTSTSAYPRLYSVNEAGTNSTTLLAYGSAIEWSIAGRDANGAIYTGAPTADAHAATKKYVDDAISNVEVSSIKTFYGLSPSSSAEPSKAVPSGYTPIAYLQDNASGCIMTDYYFRPGCKVKFKGRLDSDYGGADSSYFGCLESGKITMLNNYNGYYEFFVEGERPNIDSSGGLNLGNDSDYEVDFTSGAIRVVRDGVTLCSSDAEVAMEYTNPLFLMSLNSSTNYLKGRLYYFQIYDSDGALIRDYVPVQRDSDDAIGMYDLVGGSFLSAYGTILSGGDNGCYTEDYSEPTASMPYLWSFTRISMSDGSEIETEHQIIKTYQGGSGLTITTYGGM